MHDVRRHEQIFNPEHFGDRTVDVIGLGAVGSRVMLELARLGIRNLRGWDFDTVDDVNIGNQAYGIDDIGRPKAEALADLVKRTTGAQMDVQMKWEPGGEPLGDVLFVLPDKMSVRTEIFDAVQMTYTTQRLIEGRMGPDEYRVYSLDPNRDVEVREYKKTLYSDEKAVQAPVCGGPISVGATASVLASQCVWALITWWAHEHDENAQAPTSELIATLRKPTLFTRDFN